MNTFIFISTATTTVATTWDSGDVILLKLLAIFALVVLNGFFVASEFALVKVRGSQIDALIAQGVRNARAARRAVSHLDAYLSATQLGITLASLGLGWLGEPFLAKMIQPFFGLVGISSQWLVYYTSIILALAIVTALHIVLGEQAPKVLAIRKAVPVALWISRPMHLFYAVFRPAIWLLNSAANGLLRGVFKIEPAAGMEIAHSEEELRMIFSENQSTEGDSMGREIVINALDMKHRVARDIMTPRGEVIFLDIEENFEHNLKVALESHHTRFPMCRGHLDDAIGLIHIKDLMTLVHDHKTDLESIKREMLHVSEMMPLEKLLRFFLNKHAHLVVAVDEFGGAVGVVTLDNVIEELVGSIQDEFDSEDKEYHKISETEFDVEGSVALYEMEEITGLHLESADVTTIGGYVTHLLGHIPTEGETVLIENFTVKVTKTDGRRVISLRFTRQPGTWPKSDKGIDFDS
ncbi:MAG: hemolysin family protein [Chthoniobacterales bacterium]